MNHRSWLGRAGHRVSRNPYLTLFTLSLKRALQYRTARVLGIASALILLTIQYLLWSKVFEQRATTSAFTWAHMRTYILVVFALNGLLPAKFELEFFARVRFGDVSIDLVRPLHFLGLRSAEAAGAGATVLLFRLPVLAVLIFTIFDVSLPPTPVMGALFVVSAALGFITQCLIMFLVALGCFWFLSFWGLQTVRTAISNVLSGALVPLSLLPGGLREVALASPFAGIVFVPSSIFLGLMNSHEALVAVVTQLTWNVALVVLATWLWRISIRHVVIQGG